MKRITIAFFVAVLLIAMITLSGCSLFRLCYSQPDYDCLFDDLEKAQENMMKNDAEFRYYIYSDGTAVITGYSGTDEDLVIPDTLNGIAVGRIGYKAFAGHSELVTVVIPEGVTFIDDDAFSNLPNVKSYSLPSTLRVICGRAFASNTSLESVTIPEGVEYLHGSAFGSCDQLKTVTILGRYTEFHGNPFSCCDSLEEIIIDDRNTNLSVQDCCVIDILSGSFLSYIPSMDKSSGEIYRVPDGITTMNSSAFYKCDRLIEVILPDSLTEISDYALRNCTALEKVNIPDNVKRIGYCAFQDCKNLRELTIPKSVETIERSSFNGCESLHIYVYEGSYAASYTRDAPSLFFPNSDTRLRYPEYCEVTVIPKQ